MRLQELQSKPVFRAMMNLMITVSISSFQLPAATSTSIRPKPTERTRQVKRGTDAKDAIGHTLPAGMLPACSTSNTSTTKCQLSCNSFKHPGTLRNTPSNMATTTTRTWDSSSTTNMLTRECYTASLNVPFCQSNIKGQATGSNSDAASSVISVKITPSPNTARKSASWSVKLSDATNSRRGLFTHLLVPSSHFPNLQPWKQKWHNTADHNGQLFCWPTCGITPDSFTGWPKTSCYHVSESMRNRPDQADVRLSGPSRTTTKTPSAGRPHSATWTEQQIIDIVSHHDAQKTCWCCIAKHLLPLPSSCHSLWENQQQIHNYCCVSQI